MWREAKVKWELQSSLPALLCAVTVNVYAVPLFRPPTVIGLPAPVVVMPPGLAMTV